MIDEVDVASVFVARDARLDRWGVAQVGARLREQSRHRTQPRDDVVETLGFGRVLQLKRRENRVADQLDVEDRVVTVRLQAVETEERQLDLVAHDAAVNTLLGIERVRIDRTKAPRPRAIKAAAARDAVQTEIIERTIQHHAMVSMETLHRRRHRREGETVFNVGFRQRVEVGRCRQRGLRSG